MIKAISGVVTEAICGAVIEVISEEVTGAICGAGLEGIYGVERDNP